MLHREQLLDMLWPNVELESALNSFGKALYAARRALEPELLPRECSSYLRLTDCMVALDTEHVWIDADQFELLAETALRSGDAPDYEAALAAYGGELLPEDRYEDWCAERRSYLADLHMRLLLGLAAVHESRGDHSAAAARFREVLQHDPANEDVQRRLLHLYSSAGGPVRTTTEHVTAAPFVGRDAVLERLYDQLARAGAGEGGLILVNGEAGVGKSRLVAEFAAEARRRDCCVLWGGSGHTNHLAYGPFAVALEGWVANRSDAERQELAQRYPPLADFLPSLGTGSRRRPFPDRTGGDQLYLVPAIVRLLTDLAREQAVLLVLGDLHDLHRSSLNLLEYLAPLAAQRRWLIVGSYRDEALARGSGLRRMIDATEREGLCLRFELERLARADCDQLVRRLSGGEVDGTTLDHLHARSLGNPLYIQELVRELRERGELRVPASVRALVASQVGPLKECVRRVLALVAAGSGREIALTDLRAGGAALRPPLSDVALFDALDRALELRILEERDGFYTFRHPLVRAALYEDLSKHRRDELHAALGQ
jgi:tetratricopeptide (TPR) repeat protein